MLLHHAQRFDGKGIRRHGQGRGAHDRACRRPIEAGAIEGGAADIAVRDEPHLIGAGAGLPGIRTDDGEALAALGDGADKPVHGRIGAHPGEAVEGQHLIAHRAQLPTQHAARMIAPERIRRETAQGKTGHHQRVAERQGGGRGRGRRHAADARFLGHPGLDNPVHIGRQLAIAALGDEHRFDAEPADQRDQGDQLVRIARMAQQNGQGGMIDDAEIAVQGVGGMEKAGAMAGRQQAGHQLAADIARLAHPDHHGETVGRREGPHGGGEIVAQQIRRMA